ASAAGAEDGGDGSSGDVSALKRRLALIQRRLAAQQAALSAGKNGGSAGGAGSAASSAAPPDQQALEASVESFIGLLKARAALQAAARPASLGGALTEAGGPDAGADPIIHDNRMTGDLDSPTLQALKSINKLTAHSSRMSLNPGLKDGSRDKAGKGYDGNAKTYGEVPIIETQGALGAKTIGIETDDGGDADPGRPQP
ncbi:MAG: hypothetical protein KGL53_09000, partial [Elusimicrobia bacterium]|nr:hypothetical protein [Elusimicrobiota bacterium]